MRQESEEDGKEEGCKEEKEVTVHPCDMSRLPHLLRCGQIVAKSASKNVGRAKKGKANHGTKGVRAIR